MGLGRLAERSRGYLWAILRSLGICNVREAPYTCYLPFSWLEITTYETRAGSGPCSMVLNALRALSCQTVTVTLRNGSHFYPHFTDKENEAQRGRTKNYVARIMGQALIPSILHKFTHLTVTTAPQSGCYLHSHSIDAEAQGPSCLGWCLCSQSYNYEIGRGPEFGNLCRPC